MPRPSITQPGPGMQNTLTHDAAEKHCQSPAVVVRGSCALHSRSRATLGWALATFVLVQVGLRILIDYWYPAFRDPSFEIKAGRLQRAIEASTSPPVTVVMVGSSLTGNGFHAKYLENILRADLHQPCLVYNMSSRASGPLTDLVWIKRLLERGIRADLVLIEFAPFLFNSARAPVDVHRFPYYTLEHGDLDILERYGDDAELIRKWWTCRLVPCHGHRLTMLNCLTPELIPIADRMNLWDNCDERFWACPNLHTPAELQVIRAKAKKILDVGIKEFTPGASSVQALEELLVLLEKAKVAAALVMVPQGPTLRSYYAPQTLLELKEKVVALSRRHRCSFIDALTWLDEEEFSDFYHTTRDGAITFSTRLATEFLLPALATVPVARMQQAP